VHDALLLNIFDIRRSEGRMPKGFRKG